MRHVRGSELADVVADAATLPRGLTRHELGGGIAVSFLYGGDASDPDTCQWRVVAPDGERLQRTVGRLVELLRARGVCCEPPDCRGSTCHFADGGPWRSG